MLYNRDALRSRVIALHVALALSGAAALVYQLTWGRMLQRVFGVSDLAVATVLAAFFLGLGLGNLLGARRASKLARPALAYAALEGAVGLWALASLALLPRIGGLLAGLGEDASFEVLSLARLGLALLVLLPPTVLLGATMPVLVALIGDSRGWSRGATAMYVTNTVGATVGAGATGLWLVPAYGARVAVVTAALGSLAAAAVVVAAWRRAPRVEPAPAEPADAVVERVSATDVKLAIALAGGAGFAALAGEVVWTRVLRIVVQGTTQAFAAMLVCFLGGIAIGSALAARLAHDARGARRALGFAQLAIAVLSATSLVVVNQTPRLVGLLQGAAALSPHQVWVLLLVAAVILLPLAIAIGTAVPLAWRAAGGVGADASRRAGRVLAANTLGGLAGSLGAGFVLVPVLGVSLTVLCLVGVHLLLSAVALRTSVRDALVPRVLAVTGPVAVAALIAWIGPRVDLPYLLNARNDAAAAIIEGPGARWSRDVVFLREGRNTTVTLTKAPGNLRLANDGRPESGFSAVEPGFGPELALLGALPNVLAERRQRALVIGLGAGHTAAVLLAGPWRRVDVVELESGVVEAARVLYTARGRPFPLDDRRARLFVDDGRARLALALPASYDAIVSQPSHPWLAGSSALYTREFFAEARRSLRPGGVLALWVNLFRMDVAHVRSVVGTLHDEFPHVQGYLAEGSSLVLVASARPLALDARAAARLAGDAGVQTFLGPFGLDTPSGLGSALELDDTAAAALGRGAARIEDDRPLLELDLGRLAEGTSVRPPDLDRALLGVPWIDARTWRAIPADQRVALLLARIARAGSRGDALERLSLAVSRLDLDASSRALLAGAVAEARGDTRAAYAAYGASRSARAARAAAELGIADSDWARVLASTRSARTLPDTASPLLRAALGLGDPASLATAIQTAEAVAAPDDAPLLALARDVATRGCDAVGSEVHALASSLRSHELAWLGERCAAARGDRALGTRFADLRAQIRRALATRAYDQANACAGGRNRSATWLLLRRALRLNPGHGPAAAALAQLQAKAGRRADAERTLRTALEATRGLPRSTSALLGAARELGVNLGPPERLPGDSSSTSAAPSAPAGATPAGGD